LGQSWEEKQIEELNKKINTLEDKLKWKNCYIKSVNVVF
jgi:hypothetical protein